MLEQRHITGLSVIDHIAMITINHFPQTPQGVANLFSKLAEHEINIDMISQTLLSDGLLNISFTCNKEDYNQVEQVMHALKQQYPFFNVHADLNVSKLSVVGLGMRSQSGVAAKIFHLLADKNIPFQLVTTSEISISYTIPTQKVQESVHIISEAFDL